MASLLARPFISRTKVKIPNDLAVIKHRTLRRHHQIVCFASHIHFAHHPIKYDLDRPVRLTLYPGTVDQRGSRAFHSTLALGTMTGRAVSFVELVIVEINSMDRLDAQCPHTGTIKTRKFSIIYYKISNSRYSLIKRKYCVFILLIYAKLTRLLIKLIPDWLGFSRLSTELYPLIML